MAREIPLTQGLVTLVDDEDYEVLSQHQWRASVKKRTAYVTRWDNTTGRDIQMHRLLMNAPQDMEVDHVNGDGLDNRRCNLRLATRQQNCFNQRPRLTERASVYKGVFKQKAKWGRGKKPWLARIVHGGHTTHLGTFDSEREAALAYNSAAKYFFGEFAHLNEVT